MEWYTILLIILLVIVTIKIWFTVILWLILIITILSIKIISFLLKIISKKQYVIFNYKINKIFLNMLDSLIKNLKNKKNKTDPDKYKKQLKEYNLYKKNIKKEQDILSEVMHLWR